ncbi:polymorphic toxin-type HINT domain-containing protein [Thermobifida halotolerans]|uniref:polymorphic toxin-type HINT domain-containing protein n=1 Tax=Thermobifida halotolerans TaxID=483545 RepID=UPI000AE4422E|nr:polymorphic toxin-type HINT domain-containing protein [Thermobifida halotolerans]
MADGTSKPIEKVKTGDKVLATDPETGEQGPRTVLATIVGAGAKDLVEITVDPATERSADDDSDRETTPEPTAVGDVIIATDGHPFWAPELGQWVDAIDLTPGMWLQTSAGTWVQITSIRAWAQATTVHNLTVQGVHTYYAYANTTSLLTHNCEDGVVPTISSDRLGHIYSRHGEGARERDQNAGEFNESFLYDDEDNELLEQRLLDAVSNSDPSPNPRRRGHLHRYDYGYGNDIGRDGEVSTSTVEIVVLDSGNIWTAHPVKRR